MVVFPYKQSQPTRKIRSGCVSKSRLGATYGVDMGDNADISDVLYGGLIMSCHMRPSLRSALKTGPALSRAKPWHYTCSVDEQAGKAF